MKASLRRRFDMAERVQGFLRAHPPEGTAAAALARLEELLERVRVQGLHQRAGIVDTRSATARRDAVRRELQSKLLLYLSVLASGLRNEHAELWATLRLPRRRLPNLAFLTLARVMLQAATEHKALLLSVGMSETLLDDLAAAIVEFEKTLELTNAALSDHIGASADLRAVATDITRQVRLLDGWVRYRFAGSAELMAAWASARNVHGPVRVSSPPVPLSVPERGDDTPGVVKPAA